MNCSKGISIICILLCIHFAVLHLAKVQAYVRTYNSACLAKVNKDKDAATTSEGVAIIYPEQYLYGNLLNKNHQWTLNQHYSGKFSVGNHEESEGTLLVVRGKKENSLRLLKC